MTGDGHFRRMENILDDVTAIAVDHYGGNVSAAAQYLGLARATVYKRLKKHAELQSDAYWPYASR